MSTCHSIRFDYHHLKRLPVQNATDFNSEMCESDAHTYQLITEGISVAYPYFCLHPDLNILHVISLDFAVALYPFVLILLTYLLIRVYDSNYRLVVWAWKSA